MSNAIDLSGAVDYHYGRFPPALDNLTRLIPALTAATAALARYDQTLRGMHNGEVLLAPLRSQEAVVSSRMEGTISTLDEILRYEAEAEAAEQGVQSSFRSEVIEVALYSRAMRTAQKAMAEGQPLSPFLIRSAHRTLLSFGRGAAKDPGEFKKDQNYLADRNRKKVLFIPIKPEFLNEGVERLFHFINAENQNTLIKAAIAHVEFEALHPFNDGNGRIGRMMIPLMMWRENILTQPYFYVSAYLEEHKDEYIDRMRRVSENDEWLEWIEFMLTAIEAQSMRNLEKAENIRQLYEQMKEKFRDVLSSQWSTVAVDFVFTRPVFKANLFTSKSGIPQATAYRFLRTLQQSGLLTTLEPASGRRSALYSFEPLLAEVRD